MWMNPKYPIYIISKGRADSRLTSKALDKINCPYRIVIESQEYDAYAEHIDTKQILQLPFSNLGKGSIPARNWVWEHSISEGYARHWILDDNLKCFYRLNHGKRLIAKSKNIFRAAEDFIDRYDNIAIAGFQYESFAASTQKWEPYYLNRRIYSCLNIDNKIQYRWRGKYNEDTDLSLRVLKDGYCTILFYAFLCDKQATMTMKGGNTDNLYANGDLSRFKMAQSLAKQHPDCVKISNVDYSRFKHNKLIKKKNLHIPTKINEYGMILET